MLPLLVDALIVGLLLVVLGRGFQLQRQLRVLREDGGEIDRLIAALDRATARAETALDALRQTAEATGEDLTGRLANAQRLVDDLQFLTSRGEQAADRLAEQIRKERPLAQRMPTASSGPDQARAAGGSHRLVPAADLERTLRTLR
jgi:ABC-type transporter Mla subunit MlaD